MSFELFFMVMIIGSMIAAFVFSFGVPWEWFLLFSGLFITFAFITGIPVALWCMSRRYKL